MVLFILFIIAVVGIGAYYLLSKNKILKTGFIDVDVEPIIKKNLIYNGIYAAGFTIALIIGMLVAKYECDALHWIKLIFGGLFFGFSVLTALYLFNLHYYGNGIDEKIKKILMYGFIALFIISFFTLFLWLDGFAPYVTYPLINGINFEKGFVSPGSGKPNLAWYAICILSGAILVYFMCDHFMFKEYGVHGTLETVFFIAFPWGIIGARLWYCIGEGVPFANWIRIWDGGLTILGGAIMGILGGVICFLCVNKKYSIWVAVDCIVPTILIAQAVGRWGNFFNCEVHGVEVSMEYFKWLPEIVRNNMTYSSVKGFASPGNMYVPLFFIEAVINVFGYFLIAHVFGKRLTKVLEPGDLACAYVIWYGMVRVILEPFRDSAFNMGNNGYWSWMWSLIFVFAGSLAIIANHIVRYILKKKQNNYVVLKGDKNLSLIEFIVFSAVAICLIISASTLMSLNEFSGKIGFDGFNIGVMLLVLGVSILVYDAPAIIRYIEAKKVVNE